jgi:hypothetical protein
MGVEAFQQLAATAPGSMNNQHGRGVRRRPRHEHQAAFGRVYQYPASLRHDECVYCVHDTSAIGAKQAGHTHTHATGANPHSLYLHRYFRDSPAKRALLVAGPCPAGYQTATFTQLSCATRFLPLHCLRIRARNALHTLESCRTALHRLPLGPLERSGPARQSQDDFA